MKQIIFLPVSSFIATAVFTIQFMTYFSKIRNNSIGLEFNPMIFANSKSQCFTFTAIQLSAPCLGNVLGLRYFVSILVFCILPPKELSKFFSACILKVRIILLCRPTIFICFDIFFYPSRNREGSITVPMTFVASAPQIVIIIYFFFL